MYKDLKYLIGGSVIAILSIIGIMFFSPLSTQYADEDIGRGNPLVMDVDELINNNQTDKALVLVDSLIEAESKGLPRFAYFDRYLSDDERMEVANARADIYELQWKRIEILKIANQHEALRTALEDYVNIFGYNQESAKVMLKQLKNS